MDIIRFIVEAALATGLVGYLANRMWRWWRRPRLTIQFDPMEAPKSFTRPDTGPYLELPKPDGFAEYYGVVRNEGKTAARSVEAVVEVTAFWDGDEWRDADEWPFGPVSGTRLPAPCFLVWSGSRDTRAHIPADGGSRRLAVFLAAQWRGEGLPELAFASPAAYDPQNPPQPIPDMVVLRFRICVTGLEGETASCEMTIDWNPKEPDYLAVQGDCVGPTP